MTFDATERLIVGTMRAWFVHKAPSYLFEQQLVKALTDKDFDRIRAPFHAVMTCLCLRARRTLRIHPPGFPRVSADERAVLGLLAAAARGDAHEVAMRMNWLMRSEGQGVLAVSAERVVRIMLTAGFVFVDCPPRRSERLNNSTVPQPVTTRSLRLLG